MNPQEPFKTLGLQDYQLQVVAEHFEQRLQDLRGQNDRVQSGEQTAMLRGRIAELKEVLRLIDDTATVAHDDREEPYDPNPDNYED